MKIMIVDGNRYLLNTDLADDVLDDVCQGILKYYPPHSCVEFDDVKLCDVLP